MPRRNETSPCLGRINNKFLGHSVKLSGKQVMRKEEPYAVHPGCTNLFHPQVTLYAGWLYKRDPLLCGAILLGQKVARKCFYNITLGNYIYNYIVICPTQQDNFPHPSIHSAIPFPFPMSCAVCLSLREGRGSLSSANGGSILDPPELQGWYSDDNG